jgi:hypothetical protein
MRVRVPGSCRPQPYAAVLLAALLFAPVVWWNYTHDWASFRFQGGERFVEPARFQLHVMLQNILLVATPLPLLVLPLLWARRWSAEPAAEPSHAEPRNRLFVACVTGVPLAVFAWSALKHEPRLNWTGPIWLATLPMLGWAIVHARTLARPWLGTALRRAAGPIVGLLLVAYSVASYHLVLGVPGLALHRGFCPLHGLAAGHFRTAGSAGAAAAGHRPGAGGGGPGQIQHGQPDRLLRRPTLCGARAGRAAGDLAGDLQRQRADVHVLEPAGQPGRAGR